MSGKLETKHSIWEKLRQVALPDARFDHDYARFIPDFHGSEAATQRLLPLLPAPQAGTLFLAPDNSLHRLRAALIAAGRPFILSSYDMARGFLWLDPARLPAGDPEDLATLDVIERRAEPLPLAALSARGPMAALVTGVSAASRNGIRFGKGHGFLEIEWAIFSSLGLVTPEVPIYGLAHECQILAEEITPRREELALDAIATPGRLIDIPRTTFRPRGMDWSEIDRRRLAAIPPLAELARQIGIA